MNDLQDIYFTDLNVVGSIGGRFLAPEGKDWSCSTHRFIQNKFYFITKGSCHLQIEGRDYVAQAGDWFFIPSGTPHSYYNHKEKVFQKYWAHFDVYPGLRLLQVLNLPLMVKAPLGGKAHKLFRQYVRLLGSRSAADRLQEKAVLLQLLAEYIHLANADEPTYKYTADSKIEEVLRFMNQNITAPLSVTRLAREFHLHPNHFIRFFKEKTGQTPAKYLKTKKMERAKRFLEESDLSIAEIMTQIGESDLSNFSKQFKSYYALSPRAYRDFYKKENV